MPSVIDDPSQSSYTVYCSDLIIAVALLATVCACGCAIARYCTVGPIHGRLWGWRRTGYLSCLLVAPIGHL